MLTSDIYRKIEKEQLNSFNNNTEELQLKEINDAINIEEIKENMTPSVASIDNQNILNKNNIFNEGSPARTEGTKSLVKSKYSVKTASNHQKSRDVEMQEDIEEIDANSIILMKPIMRDKSTQWIHFDNQEKVIENIDKEINISEQNIRFKSQMQINMERLYTLNEVDEEFKSHVSDIKGIVEDYTQTDIVETFTKEVETDPIIFTNSVIQPQNEQSQKTSLFKKFKLATVNPLNIADSKPKIRIESDEFDQKDSDVHTDLSKFPLLSGLSKINEQNLGNTNVSLAKTHYIKF